MRTDLTYAKEFLAPDFLSARLTALEAAHQALRQGSGAGGEFTGWVRLPETYDKEEFARIQTAAGRIQAQSQALVVIGIGGSYLGARAVIELLGSAPGAPTVYFAGNGLSSDALLSLLQRLEGKDFSVNVISKSGTTTEPAVAFRIFKKLLEDKYGKEGARARIYATTDRQKGALKSMADREGYETFVVPDEIGGRYSVLTAVGLLPIAAAGIDVNALMAGARGEMAALLDHPSEDNAAWQYAAARHALYEGGKKIELLACYEPSFRFFAEWWKQLYGESEGKEHKGLFPASVEFTADLHSMGQYIQEGERLLLETVVRFDKPLGQVTIPSDPDDLDGLNFLAGQDLAFVNDQAMAGTRLAHVDGGVPNLLLTLPRRDADSVGRMIYFFEFACGLSGYLLGVNPFDQPGVEAYKKNMFALLGKPGYEERRAQLLGRL
jgi:glucose-6-phosphate isomerase